MVAESKANSSLGPLALSGRGESANPIIDGFSDENRGRESVEQRNSRYGESALTDFNKTKSTFVGSAKDSSRMSPSKHHKRHRMHFMPNVDHIAQQDANRYHGRKRDVSHFFAEKIYDF